MERRLVCLRKFDIPPRPGRGLEVPDVVDIAKAGIGGLGLLPPVPNPKTLLLNILSCSSMSFFLNTVEPPIAPSPPNFELLKPPPRSEFSSSNFKKSLMSPASAGGFPSLMKRLSSSLELAVPVVFEDRGILPLSVPLPAPKDNLEEVFLARLGGSMPPLSPPEEPRP